MKKTNFEASVCRTSDQHPWRFFIQYQQGDDWPGCIFDATPEGLDQCLRMTDVREFCIRDCGYTREIVDAYFHACDLNAKESGAWNPAAA